MAEINEKLPENVNLVLKVLLDDENKVLPQSLPYWEKIKENFLALRDKLNFKNLSKNLMDISIKNQGSSHSSRTELEEVLEKFNESNRVTQAENL